MPRSADLVREILDELGCDRDGVEEYCLALVEAYGYAGDPLGSPPQSTHAAAAVYLGGLYADENFTQEEVAEAADVSPGTISKWYKKMAEREQDPDRPSAIPP